VITEEEEVDPAMPKDLASTSNHTSSAFTLYYAFDNLEIKYERLSFSCIAQVEITR